MSYKVLAGILGLSFILAFFITPQVINWAFRLGAVDQPNLRKVHTQAMPRMGGVAVYLAFVLTLLITQPFTMELIGLIAGGTLVLLLGLLDDIKNISPRAKLLGQILAALTAVVFGIKVDFVTNPISGGVILLDMAAVPLTIFWIVGVTNAVNLIDGLDGLAAGVSSIAAVTLALVSWRSGEMMVATWALVLAFSVLGFLRYNFHPARIFMGDSGSMFLGFNLAVFSILSLTKSAAAFSLAIPFIVLGIPILDTFCAIVRRFWGGQSIFLPDKEHLHHRLLELGLSHRSTVLVIYVVSGVFSLCAVALTYFTRPEAMFVLTALSVLVLIGISKLGVLVPRTAKEVVKQNQSM